MYPILYKREETDFVHNGLGILSGAITAVLEEELNGSFEINIEYDSEGFLANVIENGMIVKAKANDRQEPQLFRIYAIEKSLQNDNHIIRGQHITYDLAGNFIERLNLNKVTTKEAMEAIKSHLAYPTRFNITSSNNETVSSTNLYRTNPLQMIAGMQGSILQIWGGQIERDNFNLIMHRRRGSDDGVMATYKKNLIGLEAKFDESNVVTRIFPFKYIEASEEGPEQLITIDGKYIDSPNINKYPVVKILPIDFGDDESITNKTQLYNASKNYFNTGSKDLPTVEMDVEFEALHDTEEYKDVVGLELVGMGDTITVRYSKMGIDVKAQVVNIEYDSISEKNKKVSIGNVKARLTDTVNNATDIIDNVGEKINNANEKANEAIKAANGKNTIYYGPEEPSEAQKDDIWFRTVDGEYTRTYRYDGIQWQLVVSADIRDIETEARGVKHRADEAVAKVDLATNNAVEAIEQAQGAFDKAQDAIGKSDQAFNKAQESFDKSSESIEQSTQAFDKANEAFADVSELSTKVNANTGEISTIKHTATGLQSQVSNNKSDITTVTQLANGLQTKVSNAENDIASVTQIATGLQTKVSDAEDNITLLTQTATGLQSQVNNNKGNITTVTQLAQGLKTRVGDAEGSISTLRQTATQLNSTITTVRNDLDNLEIGGRNLLRTTKSEIRVITFNGWGDFITPGDNVDIPVNEGETYTFRAYLESDPGNTVEVGVMARLMTAPNTATGRVEYSDLRIGPGTKGYSTVTFTVPKGYHYIRPFTVRARYSSSTNIKVGYSDDKLEKGDFATDWSPAPEDTTQALSAINQTIDSISTRVQSNDGKISTLTQTAQGLQTQVKDKADKSTVTQLAGVVDSKISTNDANAKFATQSQLTQTSSSLQSTITSVRNDLDGIEIVGRNILGNSKKPPFQSNNNTTSPLKRTQYDDYWRYEPQSGAGLTTYSHLNTTDYPIYNKEWLNKDMVVSITVRVGKNVKLRWRFSDWGKTPTTMIKEEYFDVKASDGWVTLKMNIPKSSITKNPGTDAIRFMLYTADTGNTSVTPYSSWVDVKDWFIGFGNKFAGYSDAPEDMATQSQISQLSTAVNLRVQKGDVINQINIDTSGILISGKKLILDGNVNVTGTFKVNDANIVSMNAAKMTTGILDAGKVSVVNLNASNINTGKLNANNVTITATNGKSKLDLSSTGLQTYDSNGKMRIALNIRSAGGAGSDPATLRFFSGNGSISAGVGMNVNDTFVLGSTANSVHTEIYSGGNTIMYANQIRLVTKEGTGGYSKRFFILNSLKSATGSYNPCLYPDASGWGYIGTSNYRMWRMYTNYLHYVDLVNLSTRDSKANIKEANLKQMQSAFDEMDLVTYNYKEQDGTPRIDELKVGWIAEESPNLITSKDKKQLSLNNTIGVMAGSMKHQQRRVDELENVVEDLVFKIANLEAV